MLFSENQGKSEIKFRDFIGAKTVPDWKNGGQTQKSPGLHQLDMWPPYWASSTECYTASSQECVTSCVVGNNQDLMGVNRRDHDERHFLENLEKTGKWKLS